MELQEKIEGRSMYIKYAVDTDDEKHRLKRQISSAESSPQLVLL